MKKPTKTVGRLEAKSLPELKPVNSTGFEPGQELLRRVRIGVTQVNRGKSKAFDDAGAAVDYLLGKSG